jgi:hypothetical protein
MDEEATVGASACCCGAGAGPHARSLTPGADDDGSWKVRHASAKALDSFVVGRPEALLPLMDSICDRLVCLPRRGAEPSSHAAT